LDTLIADATRLADARDPRAARAWERVAAAVSESESDLPAPVVARIAEGRARRGDERPARDARPGRGGRGTRRSARVRARVPGAVAVGGALLRDPRPADPL